MSREIKFRAWDPNDKRMVEWGELLPYITTNNEHEPMQRLLDRSMQFTGLRDKNGVDIYEGDVIQLVDSKIPRVVEFHQGCFVLANRKGDAVSYRELWDQMLPEVIGDIFTSPGLLDHLAPAP